MQESPSMLKPALISGVAFGIAGAIPVINWINCACCALIIGCGFLAAFLQSKECRQAGVEFRPGNGATVGLVAGLVYGAVSGVLGGIISSATGMGDWEGVMEQIQASGADLDPEVLNQISSFMESSGGLMMILIGLFFALLFGAIFGTIGGLIGGSVFKVELQPPANQQAPPPPPIG
ncbi:MAG: hypothetical protein KAJ97_06965 [Acidobacteria bacterium]|nr:hypothetical protein [Acidobacteriota bacterium]